MLDFVSLILCSLVLVQAQLTGGLKPWKFRGQVIGLILILGAFYQVLQLRMFCSRPIKENIYSLPGSFSQVDYQPFLDGIDAAKQMQSLITSGARFVSPYGPLAQPENITDPAGVIERTYLSVGHDLFSQRAYFVSDLSWRYISLPVVSTRQMQVVWAELRSSAEPLWFVDYEDSKKDYAPGRAMLLNLIKEDFPTLPKPSLQIGAFSFYRLR